MKKSTAIAIFLILFLAFIIIYLNYDSNSISKDVSINNNLENIKKIELGMSQVEVDKIMGRPYKILQINAPIAKTRYLYKIPDGVDAVCDIAFDSTMHVVDIAFEIFPQDSVINLE